MVGMATKPFHVKRLQKALGRPSTHLYMHKRTAVSHTDHPTPSPSPHPDLSTLLMKRRSGLPSMSPSVGNQHLTPSSSSSSSSLLYPPSSQTLSSLPSHHTNPSTLTPHHLHRHSSIPTMYKPISLNPELNPSLGADQPSISKHFYLPVCLQPGPGVKDISPLVDDSTPIQMELGVCPFAPGDWDVKRAELVRKHSAIYGQNSKRKNEELSTHEENVNEAAFQLCLRDPTLLVRRDELLILSRRAIKEGGYTFQHGTSKAKVSDSPSVSGHKQPLDKSSFEENFSGKGFNIGVSLPRNLSRQKKLKRFQELEFTITKNKMKQCLKLAALEKARQGNDFSTIYHLQAEIESLGTTLASLQEEYSNIKYRLRRSDRYFERKMEKSLKEQQEHSMDSLSQSHTEVSKRPRLQDPTSDMLQVMEGGQGGRYLPPTLSPPHPLLHRHSPNGVDTSSLSTPTAPSSSHTHAQLYASPSKSQDAPHLSGPSTSLAVSPQSSSSPLTHLPPSPSPTFSSAPSSSVMGTIKASLSTTHCDMTEDITPTTPSSSHIHTQLYTTPSKSKDGHHLSGPSTTLAVSPRSSSSPLTHLPPSPSSTFSSASSSSVMGTVNESLSTTHCDMTVGITPTLTYIPPSSSADNASFLNSQPATSVHALLPQRDMVAHTEQQQLVSQGSDEDDDITSDQLLANINKLATQAAANLRSLPHF